MTPAPTPSTPPAEGVDELLEICLRVLPRPVAGGRDGGAVIDDCIRVLFEDRENVLSADP